MSGVRAIGVGEGIDGRYFVAFNETGTLDHGTGTLHGGARYAVDPNSARCLWTLSEERSPTPPESPGSRTNRVRGEAVLPPGSRPVKPRPPLPVARSPPPRPRAEAHAESLAGRQTPDREPHHPNVARSRWSLAGERGQPTGGMRRRRSSGWALAQPSPPGRPPPGGAPASYGHSPRDGGSGNPLTPAFTCTAHLCDPAGVRGRACRCGGLKTREP